MFATNGAVSALNFFKIYSDIHFWFPNFAILKHVHCFFKIRCNLAKFLSGEQILWIFGHDTAKINCWRKKNKAKIDYTTGNAERTGLPAESFDMATCFYGFHEVPYQGRLQILSEMHRLLLPSGWAAILDISPFLRCCSSYWFISWKWWILNFHIVFD